MHTWKDRSYLPTSWPVLWMRYMKEHWHMRSSVLLWNWQISWRAAVPGQYFWGFFSLPAFKNSLCGALPPTVSQSFFLAGSFPAGSEGPASTAICTSCLVGDNPGDHAASSSFLASSLLLFFLSRVGGLCWCLASIGVWACIWACAWVLAQYPSHPLLGMTLVLAMLE